MSFKVEQKIGKYTYVYEATSFWDKSKNQSRQKRKLLGRRDPVTGSLIKTQRQKKTDVVKIQDYGNIYFLNKLWKQTSLYKIIKSLYPEERKEIQTLVNYVVSENKPYYLLSPWSEYNYTDNKKSKISSQRISELLEKLGARDNKQNDFFELWVKSQKEIGGLYFDITSISSYSQMLTMVEWGYNRDKEKLRQINLGLAQYLFSHVILLLYT